MPKVSVIMGVYNCKNLKLLRKSVQSIVDQTFSDWEFIICNDGSSDDTYNNLKKLELIDKRIRILTYEKNKGLANALNVCAKEAKGEYIARQDDDDISKPERFEKQLKFFDEHPEFSIVSCIADVFDNGGIWGEFKVDEKPTQKSFLWSSPFLHPATMFRADALKKAGYYRVAKETRRCEDYDLFMRMYSMGYKGYNIQEKLYEYYIVINDNKYRPMKYRVDESIVRFKGYKQMGIMLRGIPYVFKPIAIGLIPQRIFKKIQKKQY